MNRVEFGYYATLLLQKRLLGAVEVTSWGNWTERCLCSNVMNYEYSTCSLIIYYILHYMFKVPSEIIALVGASAASLCP